MSDLKAPEKCPRCFLPRNEYIEWYKKYWGNETSQAGAGVAWSWHCKSKQEKDCESVAAFLAKAKSGVTLETDPESDDYYKKKQQKKGKMTRRTPSPDPKPPKKARKEKAKEKADEEEDEQEKPKEKEKEKELDIEELAMLMTSDPGEACRRMIGNTFTPVISDVVSNLQTKEKELVKELGETRNKIHKIKSSAEAFTKHMVEGCKQISAVKAELDRMSTQSE